MKNIEELKNIIDRFYVKYSAITSEVENILQSCGASDDDSSDEGYFAGMTDSQIETCYSKIRDLIKYRHENINPDYFTEDTLVDFDLQNLVFEESFSVYEQMNEIDDEESLNENYNVKDQRTLKKLQENAARQVTVDDIKRFVNKLKEELPYGFLTVSDTAVRYMWEEMDCVNYATIEELVVAMNRDPEALEYVEDNPFGLTDYFTETASIHHAFEIEEFVETVKKLNVKYFGVEIVDEADNDFIAASETTLDMF